MLRLTLLVSLVGCLGSEEAPRVALPVGTTAAALPVSATDLGYQVQVAQIRIGVTTVQFTIEGESHADVTDTGTTNLVPPVPHPGHSAGGEVTGELPGNHVFVWNGEAQPAVGTGTLIVGTYQGANFAFRATDAADGLDADDRLLGHAFHITGTVTRDEVTRPFDAVLDVEPDTQVIGAVFEATITEASTSPLAFVFYPTDPYELDSGFDGIDFFELTETAGVLQIGPGDAAHNVLRRAIQTHDHYAVVVE